MVDATDQRDISRSANALLRVLRHGLCSFIHNKSKSATNDQIFQQQVRLFITAQDDGCLYEIITTSVRTATEIDDKSPTKVQVRKAYYQDTVKCLQEIHQSRTKFGLSLWRLQIIIGIQA